jgi:hypothetical protein
MAQDVQLAAAEEPPAAASRDDEGRPGDKRRAVAMLLVLGVGLVIGAFLLLRPHDRDEMAGAPFVTSFVASWRPEDEATVWTVDAVDPQDDALTYEWRPSVDGCGTFSYDGPVAVWFHPRGVAGDTCRRTTTTPDGGIAGSVTVVISDGTFNCTVAYRKGSAMGSMAYPATCVRVGS